MSESKTMRISLITDEVSNDPATAFELGRRWGIEHFELRHAYRWRVPVGPAWAAERVAAAVRDYGVRVTAISPGLFKPTMRTDGSTVPISTDTPEEVRRHLRELLPAFFGFAESVGARNIVVFALRRGEADGSTPPQIVIDSLAEAAEEAAAENFQLLLENGAGSWADTAEASAAILEAVDCPHLRLTWDPANAAWADPQTDPVAGGYPLVAPHVGSVHVKDLVVGDAGCAWATLGEGIIDWPKQLGLLADGGYDGFLTAEPHYQHQPGLDLDLVERCEDFVARLRAMIEAV